MTDRRPPTADDQPANPVRQALCGRLWTTTDRRPTKNYELRTPNY
jgi:hypothetical protein